MVGGVLAHQDEVVIFQVSHGKCLFLPPCFPLCIGFKEVIMHSPFVLLPSFRVEYLPTLYGWEFFPVKQEQHMELLGGY